MSEVGVAGLTNQTPTENVCLNAQHDIQQKIQIPKEEKAPPLAEKETEKTSSPFQPKKAKNKEASKRGIP